MNSLPRTRIIAAALFVSGVCAAEPPEMLNTTPIVMPEVKVSERVPPRKIYEKKVEKLWDGLALKRPTIRYLDVLAVAYDPARFDLVRVLILKKEYRAKLGSEHVFLCNYGAVANEVPIKWILPNNLMKKVTGSGGFSGQYATAKPKQGMGFDYKTGRISLADDAPMPALLHASGAALSAAMSKKSVDYLKTMSRKARDAYVQRQIEFELQLQDLNRFHASVRGVPIMSPLDTVRALAMLGFRMDPETLAKVLAEGGAPSKIDDVKAAINEGVVDKQYETVLFDHAFRIVRGMRQQATEDTITEDAITIHIADASGGLQELSGGARVAQLKKILFEAPGHI